MSKVAHIVAIKADSLDDLGFGITNRGSMVDHILDEGQVWVGPRAVLEEDFDFVQPIPYIVIRRGDEVLAYERGATGGDARLHSKVSVGFGGHVDLTDAVVDGKGAIDLRKTMIAACKRELEEELGVRLELADVERLCRWTHAISSDASAVDEVHIGLVATIEVTDLPDLDRARFETVIENARFRHPSDLIADQKDGIVELESWTNFVLSHPL